MQSKGFTHPDQGILALMQVSVVGEIVRLSSIKRSTVHFDAALALMRLFLAWHWIAANLQSVIA